jgi:two-component sensor histidine kinase
MKSFIEEFIQDIAMTYQTNRNIHIDPRIENIPLDIDSAIPVSLIINELITNAFKYAFPDRTQGTITVRIKSVPENYLELSVHDNGIGLPDGFTIEESDTLGMQLIRGLTKQIRGKLSVRSNEGTDITITFPSKTNTR